MSAPCREPTHARTFESHHPLPLERGGSLPSVRVRYETWGELRSLPHGRSNAVLICHALTGDSHVAKHHPGDKPGWWDLVVGPGKYLDTDRLFVVCSNTLGGCSGTTGPGDVNPDTGRRWGPDFPAITQRDAVEVQRRLVDHLGINRLAGVVGGSMGGQQALQWALDHGGHVDACCVVACGPRLSSQAMAFDVVGRNAILRDPHFHGGDYYGKADQPRVGLALARMLAHITYLSRESMTAKFDPERDRPRDLDGDFARSFEAAFGVGSYLAHQGDKFVERFDANSYLTLTRAMDRFDVGDTPARLAGEFARRTSPGTRFGVVSFSSDWLFPPSQSRDMVEGLTRAGRRASYLEVGSDGGHDAFLLPGEVDQYGRFVRAIVSPDDRLRPAGSQLPADDKEVAPLAPNDGLRPAGSQPPADDGEVAPPAPDDGLRPAGSQLPRNKPDGSGVAATLRVAGGAHPTSIFHEGRLDHDVILDLVPTGASVLDLGCGDGVLLDRLRGRGHERLAGVDVSTANVLACVERGLDVVDADLNRPLSFFGDGQFDVVILSQALQSVERTVDVLREVLRVGRLGIVSFPNFAWGPLREVLARDGRSPKAPGAFSHEWYDSPNKRFPSIADFHDLCRVMGLRVEREVYLDTAGNRRVVEDPNLNADLAVIALSATP